MRSDMINFLKELRALMEKYNIKIQSNHSDDLTVLTKDWKEIEGFGCVIDKYEIDAKIKVNGFTQANEQEDLK